jgi:hypothetical protein
VGCVATKVSSVCTSIVCEEPAITDVFGVGAGVGAGFGPGAVADSRFWGLELKAKLRLGPTFRVPLAPEPIAAPLRGLPVATAEFVWGWEIVPSGRADFFSDLFSANADGARGTAAWSPCNRVCGTSICEEGWELWPGAVVACFPSKTFTASSLERWRRVCRIPIEAISSTPAATAAQRKADRPRGERNQFALVPANGGNSTCGGRASETTALQSPQ